MMLNGRALIAIVLVSVLLFAGCVKPNEGVVIPPKGGDGTIVTPGGNSGAGLSQFGANDLKTATFSSADELLKFIKSKQQVPGYYPYGGGIMMRNKAVGMMEERVMMPTLAADTAQGAPAPSAGSDYSQTNNQVAGVDEADLIKTDGNYIYTISAQTLYIIKAYPGEEASVVYKIKYEEGYTPSEIFVLGDKLAVMGNFWDNKYFENMDIRPADGMSFLHIYDISDKKAAKRISDYKFEGNYFRARMKGDYIYLVSLTTPQARPYPMPIIMERGEKIAMPVGNIYYFNHDYKSPQFANVHSINLAKAERSESKAVVVESGENMYMSEGNIYITYTEYINEWEIEQGFRLEEMQKSIKLGKSDAEVVKKIMAADVDVLPEYEKTQKIRQIYEQYFQYLKSEEQDKINDAVKARVKEKMDSYKHLEYTIINRIAVEGGKITPNANGKVPGHIVNQFSMDEYDGVLRIATTLNARWDRYDGEQTRMVNNIYTLNPSLNILDKLEGIAQGEQIYSTRFMGKRMYMVTFRQVDPFFVYDLSDPRDITELGELKIPGFSRYMHPYDENTIIGIGKDATDSGRQTGLKISLFDVSDPANPKEIAKYAGKDKYAESNALYEHRAFLFSKEKELLVIPAYNYNYEHRDEGYNGALVFRISKDVIELRGLIDHSQNGGEYYSPSVERSLYIKDMLYTKSESLLRINALGDLHSVKNVSLGAPSGDIIVY